MEELLKQLLEEVKSLKDGQKQLFDGQKQLFEEVKSIRSEMVTKEDMDENACILRALEYASQVNAAEMEGLKLSTATKESIQVIDAKFDVLNERLFRQETEIRLIKIAK